MAVNVWHNNKVTSLEVKKQSDTDVALMKEAGIVFKKYIPEEFNLSLFAVENRGTREWLTRVLASGTMKDKVAAMAYVIALHPLHTLHYFDSLIANVSPLKNRLCMKAMSAINGLLIGALLPDRALIPFEKRSASSISNLKKFLKPIETSSGLLPAHDTYEYALILWYYEHELKIRVNRYLTAANNVLMSDTFDLAKKQALMDLMNLALKKPEGRKLIVGFVVNKFGDRSKPFVSSVIHHLRILVLKHRHLVPLVIEEIRILLFRPNLVERARYYAIVFLSMIQLPSAKSKGCAMSGQQLSLILVKLYAAFFHSAVQQTELSERLIGVILTGLKRAVPFLPDDKVDDLSPHMNDIFRLVHTCTSFPIALQALSVLFQLSMRLSQFRDRYYASLYRKLLEPSIRTTSSTTQLLHLLYQSILRDSELARIRAFLQRLLQMAVLHTDMGFVIGLLLIVDKLRQNKKAGEEGVDVIVTGGALKPCEWREDKNAESEEEHFSDAPISDDEGEQGAPSQQTEPIDNKKSSWIHRSNQKREASDADDAKCKKTVSSAATLGRYDPAARVPQFAGATEHLMWPLVTLASHSHPTVALFARTMLRDEALNYTGDPTEDFAVLRFLEKFAFKKPKSAKSFNVPGQSLRKRPSSNNQRRNFAIQSAEFRDAPERLVPADEQFMQKYFQFIKEKGIRTRGKKGEDVSDDEFDAFLQKHERGLMVGRMSDFDYEDMDDLGDSDVEDREDEFAKMDGLGGDESAEEFDSEMEVDDDEEGYSDESGASMTEETDLEKLFVDADEIGDMYDNQETAAAAKQRKWQDKRLFLQSSVADKKLAAKKQKSSQQKFKRRK